MKVTKDISKCYQECPHFELDGGPGPVMYCGHPDAPDSGYIISHPECDTGFPKKCPLIHVAAEDLEEDSEEDCNTCKWNNTPESIGYCNACVAKSNYKKIGVQ